MIKDNQKLLNHLLVILDGLFVILAFSIAYFLKFSIYSPLVRIGFLTPQFGYFLFKQYTQALLFIVPIYLIIYSSFHLYAPRRTFGKRIEIWNIFKSNILGILFFIGVLYFMKISIRYSRWFTIYFFVVNIFMSIFFRMSLRLILKYFRRKGLNLKHIILVGYSNICECYIDQIKSNPSWGYQIHGIISDNKPIGFTYRDVPVIATTNSLPVLLDEHSDLDEIAITLGLKDYQKLENIVGICEKSGVHTKFLPDYNHIIPTKPYIEDVNGIAVVNIRKVPLNNWLNMMLKRIVDIIGASVALIIFSIPMLVISCIIKATSPGPLIFSQIRVGMHNKKFKMYKFRSMCEQTESSEKKAWTVKDDPRVTPIGRFIRKTSIDELPQLINVLKGEMSLVGPRPERPYFVEQFKEEIPRYMIKHQVRPGLTGWAQVNGYRGDTSIQKRIDCDLYYIENWTLGLDFKILIMTFFTGFVNKNAY